MIKIFLTVIFVATSLFAEINWEDDYKSALKKAETHNKKVLLMFSEEDCPDCQKLQNEVFSDKAVSKYIIRKFVSVELDVEYDSRKGFKVYKTPTFYFLDSDGKQIGRALVGVIDAKSFLTKLQVIDESK